MSAKPSSLPPYVGSSAPGVVVKESSFVQPARTASPPGVSVTAFMPGDDPWPSMKVDYPRLVPVGSNLVRKPVPAGDTVTNAPGVVGKPTLFVSPAANAQPAVSTATLWMTSILRPPRYEEKATVGSMTSADSLLQSFVSKATVSADRSTKRHGNSRCAPPSVPNARGAE